MLNDDFSLPIYVLSSTIPFNSLSFLNTKNQFSFFWIFVDFFFVFLSDWWHPIHIIDCVSLVNEECVIVPCVWWKWINAKDKKDKKKKKNRNDSHVTW